MGGLQFLVQLLIGGGMTVNAGGSEPEVHAFEAGIADLLAAYETAEESYFAATGAFVPLAQVTYSSNTSAG